MGILDRVLGVRKTRFGIKAAEIPLTRGYISEWSPTSWADPNWDNVITQGVQANSAVFQCMSTLAFGFPEPPPVVMNNGDPDPKHALQRLLTRPNPVMSHAEMMVYTMIYRAAGGNCYLHKIRNNVGMVVELWPYNIAQMWPVPSRFGWVEKYGYYDKDQQVRTVDVSEVIHLKWPFADLANPMVAMSPLMAVFREVNTDTEATRYLYALLKNDAVMRGVITLPEGIAIPGSKAEMLKAQFNMRHGGDNRGGVAILEQGATYQRVSLNLQELAFEALRRVPESRIAGAFRVPAILAGLYVGLEKATYANYREARSQLTEDTFVPLWRSDAVELTQALAPEFDSNPDRLVITYDTGKVAALQENEDSKYTRVVAGYDAGLLMKNEARAIIGLPPVKDLKRDDPEGDVFKDASMTPDAAVDLESGKKATVPILGYHIESGVVSRNEARTPLGLPPVDESKSEQIRELKEDLGVIQMAVNVGIPLETALELIGLSVTLPKPEPQVIDAIVSPPQLTDEGSKSLKVGREQRIEAIREKMQAAAAAKIEADITAVMP